MTTRTSRTLEELVELQDKAITALGAALKATQLALEALQSARLEQGTPTKFEWTPGNPVPNIGPYIPIVSGDWGTSVITTGGNQAGGLQTMQVNAASSEDQLTNWNTALVKALDAIDTSGKAIYDLQSQGSVGVCEGGNI